MALRKTERFRTVPHRADDADIAMQQENRAVRYAVGNARAVSISVPATVVDIRGRPLNPSARPAAQTENSYLDSARKRVFDVTGALTLLLLLAPLLLFIALVIRMTSKGPILFRQKRNGANMKPFILLKFRSMYVAPEDEAFVQQASRVDPRITPIGRVIRRTSIDELPQLINVLKGEMSLIGPRPHAISHDEFYGQRISTYASRFAARPGLSGLAQVNGARGATPEISDMARRVDLDLEYLKTASLKTDVRIVAATVREMLFSSHAY